MTANSKIHTIIHTASAAAAAVGAGLAQIPGSDMPVLIGIQTAMIASIGKVHGVSVAKGSAETMIPTFAAGYGGRLISQTLIGWIPGLGNAVNASTAAGITEAIGWAADAYFREE